MSLRSSLRLFGSLIALAACSAPAKPAPAPVTPVPTLDQIATEPSSPSADQAPSCNDAAAGLERGTVGLREPGVSILAPMLARCRDDNWGPSAIACFAKLDTDGSSGAGDGDHDLAACALELVPESRDRMFAELGVAGGGKAAVAIAIARLANMKVGIEACDRFVSTVLTVLSCDRMPLDQRAELGTETVDFWSLPTAKLSPQNQARMSAVCNTSLSALEQQAKDAGCAP